MKTTTRAYKLLTQGSDPLPAYRREREGHRIRNLNKCWNMLSKPRKRFAAWLVKEAHWSTFGAIQHAYVWGYDKWIVNVSTREWLDVPPAKSFGFRR